MPAEHISKGNDDGTTFGQSPTDKISVYGVTPVVQRSSSIQASSLISTSALATVGSTLQAWMVEVSNTLTGLGLWKGAA